MEKWFTFHWYDGTVTYGKGKTVAEAANFSGSALRALDYYEEAKELPDDRKEVRIKMLNGDDNILPRHTMFAEQVLKQIAKGLLEVVVCMCGREYKLSVKKEPYQYVLTQHA